MTTALKSLAEIIKQEKLPLAAGAAERAEVGCLGLPDAVRAHEADFAAIVLLVAHRESQGFPWLGFNDGDAVEFDRYEDSSEPADADDPDDFRVTFTDHRPYWDMVLAIHAAAKADGSPFMVELVAPIPANAEFAVDLQAKRLMFARAGDNEVRLWQAIRDRAAAPTVPLSPAAATILEDLFPQAAAGTHEAQSRTEQIAAATLIATQKLSIVTGPPGTGKTFTIVRAALTWLCHELEKTAADPTDLPQKIMLMAPTGRASSRMRELIEEALGKLEADKAALKALGPHGPTAIAHLREAGTSTIHSALGYSTLPGRPFKRNRDNRLDAGLVIVDETSMLGLELARRLFDALPDKAQICLVGDPGQLRAVEMGSVLYDIVTEARTSKTLAACHSALTISRRFPPGSPIDLLARAINGGDTDDSLAVTDILQGNPIDLSSIKAEFHSNDHSELQTSTAAAVRWLNTTAADFPRVARTLVALHAQDIREHAHDADVTATLKRSIILCVHRHGANGAHTLSAYATRHLASNAAAPPSGYPNGSVLMITRNNRNLDLSNGDLAIVDGRKSPALAVFAPKRMYNTSLLPQHAPAAALTVHKSQGSEWNHVIVLLPPDQSRHLSHRLLFTACTRAVARVTLVTALPSPSTSCLNTVVPQSHLKANTHA
jgi:exodeoxyribonuclease V alpha subunit